MLASLQLQRRALKEYRFRPARGKGRPVADWAEVDVIVDPSP